jgi:hypothetical protein
MAPPHPSAYYFLPLTIISRRLQIRFAAPSARRTTANATKAVRFNWPAE